MVTPNASAKVHVGMGLVNPDTFQFAFLPSRITIVIGINNTVQWTNNDTSYIQPSGTPHTVTANNGCFNSGDVAPGAQFTLTFVAAGTYNYHCIYHLPSHVGTVVVKAP